MGAPRIFISVAEDSADAHAASLVTALRQRWPDVRLTGLTGPRLRTAGVETVFDMTAQAAMLTGIIGRIPAGRRALRAAERSWSRSRPDLVIVMDSSALHLPMARRAKQWGLRVLYYIAPQTWASRAYRNRRLATDVDRVACILPFEQAYLRRHLVHADYVGHPLFEQLAMKMPKEDAVARMRAAGKPVVALLPGSRRQVIDAVLPLQLEVVRRLRSAGVVVQPYVSALAADRVQQIRRHIIASGHAAEIVTGDNPSLLTAADLVLVASGTATLEVASYRKPMIVLYDAGRALRLPYRLFRRWVITTPHLALVNVLAGAPVVPEFMPFVEDVGAVADVARELLRDEDWRAIMTRQLDGLVRPLENSRASANVCGIIGRMLGERK